MDSMEVATDQEWSIIANLSSHMVDLQDISPSMLFPIHRMNGYTVAIQSTASRWLVTTLNLLRPLELQEPLLSNPRSMQAHGLTKRKIYQCYISSLNLAHNDLSVQLLLDDDAYPTSIAVGRSGVQDTKAKGWYRSYMDIWIIEWRKVLGDS